MKRRGIPIIIMAAPVESNAWEKKKKKRKPKEINEITEKEKRALKILSWEGDNL